MCGFAGYFLYNNNIDFNRQAVLKSMGNQVAHRGPDDEQLCMEENIGVIFKRLSIVDIDGGRQPLINEAGTIKIVVNGEIYNYKDLIRSLKQQHRFYTKSDCEVLLHLYEEKGIEFLKDINGMFALALWDMEKKILLLARDRLGIKPLYYSNSGDRLLFGSEIKSLLPFPDCPREFNWFEALNANKKLFVNDNYIVETYFKGINQLRGGHYLIARENDNNITIRNYWSIFDSIADSSLYENALPEQLEQEYHDLLCDSVNLMLLGDVEIGLFLSGGIDSSAIAALAKKTKEIKTFSVLNQDTLESEDSQYGNKVATILGLTNYQVDIGYDPLYHDAAFWKFLVWQCETYECGTEQLFKYELYRYIRSAFPNLKIVLLGQGSDEFNGGYAHKYINETYPEKFNRWNDFEQRLYNIEQSNYLSGTNENLSYFQNYINREYIADLKNSPLKPSPWYSYLNMHAKGLQLYQLLHEDRTAMTNSIENRVPFLDHRLIEMAVKVPRKYFSRLFWNKSILRNGMKNALPGEFCNRPKVPFIFDNKNHFSRKIILDIITGNNDELIHYAFGDKETPHEVLNRQQVEKLLNRLKGDPGYKGIDDLRFLVNMGILARKVGEDDFTKTQEREKIRVNHTAYCNNIKPEQSAYREIVKKFEAANVKGKKQYDLFLAANATILTDANGQWFIFLDGELVEIIEELDDINKTWIKVLGHASKNGKDISHSLAELDKSEEEVTDALARSLKAKVIYKVKRKRRATIA